jgi:hypothetical protein
MLGLYTAWPLFSLCLSVRLYVSMCMYVYLPGMPPLITTATPPQGCCMPSTYQSGVGTCRRSLQWEDSATLPSPRVARARPQVNPSRVGQRTPVHMSPLLPEGASSPRASSGACLLQRCLCWRFILWEWVPPMTGYRH